MKTKRIEMTVSVRLVVDCPENMDANDVASRLILDLDSAKGVTIEDQEIMSVEGE